MNMEDNTRSHDTRDGESTPGRDTPDKDHELISGVLAAAAKKSNQQIVECEKCHRTYFLDSCISRCDGYELCPACRKFFVLRCSLCGKNYRADIFNENGYCRECADADKK
jgi:hypothetical protein